MLPFYESLRKHDVPENMKDEIFNASGDKVDVIEHFNKINIFIGPNNSGKSILLREFLKTTSRTYYGGDSWEEVEEIVQFLERVKSTFKSLTNSNGLYSLRTKHGEIFVNLLSLSHLNELSKYRPDYNIEVVCGCIEDVFSRRDDIKDKDLYICDEAGSRVNYHEEIRREYIIRILSEAEKMNAEAVTFLKKARSLTQAQLQFATRIYVPGVRTLRPFAKTAEIEGQTRKEYSFEKPIIVFNGQDIPDRILTLKTTDFAGQQLMLQYEKFLSEEFFNNEPVGLTFHSIDRVLNIKVGSEQQRPIHQLGDGLQMIIILTFPFFVYPSGIVSIEEPELYLHPGMQKAFIRFLSSHERTKDFQINIASHSNHIIDSVHYSGKISLFTVKKRKKESEVTIEEVPDFIVENVADGNENVLSLLGITNTSVYLSNCTIWVEGITDRIYLQKYISAFLENKDLDLEYAKCRNFKEGVHYSFALTGGDSIIHWDFDDKAEYDNAKDSIIVKKLCSKSFVVVDNDFSKNSERKAALKEILGVRFLELPCPEVENLLSAVVINKVVMEYDSVQRGVRESVLPFLSVKDLASKKIGTLIDNTLLKNYPSVKKFAASEKNASLKSSDKYMFCKKAVKHIDLRSMTEPAISVAKELLNFVMVNNV